MTIYRNGRRPEDLRQAETPGKYPQNLWVRAVLLAWLAFIVSTVEVHFVGDLTLYSPNSNAVRAEMHERVIRNQPPENGWAALGANGINIRIAVPYLVEFVHYLTGARVAWIYQGVDFCCLWLGTVILFLFLNRQFTVLESALACGYFAAILPITFAFHVYHPYDRVSFLAWLLCIWCARSGRIREFGIVSIIAVLIKYDAIMLPVLFFACNCNRQNWRRLLIQCSLISATLISLVALLIALIPGGFEARDPEALILRNLTMMIGTGLLPYAPILAFGLPLALAISGYGVGDRFVRASVWFAGLIAVILFATSNFQEVRAEQMLVPLLAPGALLGLRRILGNRPIREES